MDSAASPYLPLFAKTLLCILLLGRSSLYGHAQLEGLWLAEKVEVGNQNMTPVAKWTRFNRDGSTSSGNGWLQHTVGKWKFDTLSAQLALTHENGWIDEAGPFTVSNLGKERMTWERMEEGEKVKVSWKRIEILPSGPGDLLLGLWDIEKIEKEGKDVSKELDPENKMWAFMRWDRIFSFKNHPKGLSGGHWLMNGHYPVLNLVSNEQREQWQISFEDDKMVWKSQEEENDMAITFRRIHHFPSE